MSYQGHEVNFSQPTDSQFNELLMEVGRINHYTHTLTNKFKCKMIDIWNHQSLWVENQVVNQALKGHGVQTHAIVKFGKNTNAITI